MPLPMNDVMPDVDLSSITALDFEHEEPCAVPLCDDRVEYRWANRMCGCAELICTVHAKALIELVRERAGQAASGGCMLCGQEFINVPFVMLFVITPITPTTPT